MVYHEQLLSIVSQVTGVGQSEIMSNSRNRQVCAAKQLYAHFLRNKFNLLFKQISNIMKNDHTTVIHSVKVVENMIWIKDEKTLGYINEINHCLMNLEWFNLSRKLKVNVPIDCDIEALKTVLINQFRCSFEFTYE
jgi:hypothetical protein